MFESTRDFADTVLTAKPSQYCRPKPERWCGDMTLPQAARYAMRGAYEEDCRTANKLLAKIDATLEDRAKPQWVPGVTGAYPMVPDYLAGFPENMRQLAYMESDTAPVKIVASSVSSAGVSAKDVEIYAAAIAALALAVGQIRPVEFYMATSVVFAGSRAAHSLVRMDDKPVNVSQVVAMYSPAVSRQACYTLGYVLAGIPTYAGNNGLADKPENFGVGPLDIFVPGILLDTMKDITTDPAAWVNKHLAKYRHAGEDA